jgi:mono/diheme cytochrome c family protein
MQLQVLDEDGLALRTSGWMWTKNKENRGCIGCHEDGEVSPENNFAKAIGNPAADLMLPPERRRTVDFTRDIKPILDAKCVSCHKPQDTLIKAEGFPKSYAELLSGVDDKGHGTFVDPGRARTSRMIWAIYGKNTSRPWDGVSATGTIKAMPPAGSPQLTDDEKRAIAEWIDLGAQFRPVPSHPVQTKSSTRGQQ